MVDPAFPASLAELPEPELPGPSWARIAVTTGGICGSDLHLFAHNTGPSPTLASIGTFPFVLGHETAGRVVEAGSGVLGGDRDPGGHRPVHPVLAPGDRPAVRQLRRAGGRRRASTWTAGSSARADRWATPRTSGGGWADTVVAHESMLHPLPDTIDDRGASLYEPVSIACHGLMRASPDDGDSGAHRWRRHHRAGCPGRAARAVPALPGHGAGPPPASRHGRDGMRGRPRRVQRARQRSLGGAGVAERGAGGRAQAAQDADGRLSLRDRGGRIARSP